MMSFYPRVSIHSYLAYFIYTYPHNIQHALCIFVHVYKHIHTQGSCIYTNKHLHICIHEHMHYSEILLEQLSYKVFTPQVFHTSVLPLH